MNLDEELKKFFKFKKVLVCGGTGHIGTHLVKKLKSVGAYVRVVDLKLSKFDKSVANEVVLGDLRNPSICQNAVMLMDYVFQLAADFGGIQHTHVGVHDSDIMHNSMLINLNICKACENEKSIKRIFYSSSACAYNTFNQMDSDNPVCVEDSAYPALPDSEYGWEKLVSERIYSAFSRNHHFDVRVARYHNILGELGDWEGGREKAPAAICRKVARAVDGEKIEIFGSGEQTRSFLYVDECIEGTLRFFINNIFEGPVNIGSEEMITINNLAKMVIDISGKKLKIKNITGPTGVNGRCSNNKLYKEKMGWEPSQPLRVGMEKLYKWVEQQIKIEEKC